MDKKIIEFLETKQIKVISDKTENEIEIWRSWYRGHVDKFHDYKIYTGKRTINAERKSMNMASKVCQRWADLLLNEKVEVNALDEYTQTRLRELLQSVNFFIRGNNLIEYAFALGGGFFIQYWDGVKTCQKYVSQDYMYPITYDSGRLTEAAFASRKVIDGVLYTYLETHLLGRDETYIVDNVLLQKQENSELREVGEDFYKAHGILPKWETGLKTPLFQSVRPNIANRNCFDSPFGQSVFSGATDILKAIDAVYDSYYKEFILGKKRTFVNEGVLRAVIDPVSNTETMAFDPNDEVFYSVYTDDETKEPIKESNPELRVDAHDTALQTQLSCLSQAVGFGGSGFRWNDGNVSTATQIISENSEMFRALKKHESLLSETIINMCRGLLHVERIFGGDLKLKPETEITVDFDDSIIEDTGEIKRQALLELNAGLIDNIEYYMRVYKLTEAQAVDFKKKMDARTPSPEEEPIPEGDFE